jgi:probable rRNA maturation factor|tara:strand:- start:479 stop:934 length:456 start_codon:yes stop_codon:yes gene_type:complete
MIKINVIEHNSEWFDYIKNPKNYINRKINKLNSRNKNFIKNNIFCTLLLSDNTEIKYLNKKFRNKNKDTDVLSFPFHSKASLRRIFRNEKEIYLGDIIINFKKIKKKNFKKEFDRLWIHGLIHLFGYDHKKEKDYLIMHGVEKEYMNMIND